MTEARSRDERTVHPSTPPHGRFMLRADRTATIQARAGTTSMVSMSSKRPGHDSGNRRRHEARAHEASGARRAEPSRRSSWPARRRGIGSSGPRRASGCRLHEAGRSGILRIGTVNYIDSLNPFNYIEAQATERDDHDLSAARPVDTRNEGIRQGDWAKSWKTSEDGKDWTFKLRPNTKWSDGEPMTAADAAWTINTTIKYAEDGDCGGGSGRSRTSRAREAPDCDDARDPLRRRRSGTCSGPARDVPVVPEHVWEPLRRSEGRRQGLKTFRPQDHLPVVTGGRLHDVAVREEGHDGVHPVPRLLGADVERRRGRADLLHELGRMIADLGRRRTSTGSTRCRSTR